MSSSDWLTLSAMFFGPVVAVLLSVLISLWYQNRKQKLDAKEGLFKTLMVHRRFGTPHYDAVNALNLIDLVFADNDKIVALWHRYHDAICQPQVNWAVAYHDYLDMLSEMAKELGYKTLSQTAIDKCYTPLGHIESAKLSEDIQKEFLRVLQHTANLVVDKRNDEEPSSQPPPSSN